MLSFAGIRCVMGNGVPALKAYGCMKPARTTRTVVAWRSNICIAGGCALRLKRAALLLSFAVLAAPSLRAEYVVLRSGQRLRVTGYQLLGDKYRLQIAGGSVEVAAEDVVAIEPEDVFTPVPAKPIIKPPFR